MSIKSAPFYTIVCDYPGCGTDTGDLGEYAAWSDLSQAVEEWESSDCLVVENGPDDKRFYCREHTIWNPDEDDDCAMVPLPEGYEGEFILLERRLRLKAKVMADAANTRLRTMVLEGRTRDIQWERDTRRSAPV